MSVLFGLYKRLPLRVRVPLSNGLEAATRYCLANSRLMHLRGLPSLGKVRHDDVFIVSFPRSGNTLTRFLIANMVFKDVDITLANIDSLIPYLPRLVKSHPAVTNGPFPRLFKTHEAFYDNYPRMIYLVRDGRDALVSYYHRQRQQGKVSGSFGQYVAQPGAAFNGGLTWAEHVSKALDAQARHPERVLILKFEDLIGDLRGAAERLIDFCGFEVTEEDIARAVDACAFERLQRREAETKLSLKGTMFRQGKAGTWVDEFSEEEAAAFWRQAGDLMTRLGYAEHPGRLKG